MIHPRFLWTFLAFAPLSMVAQREFVHISTTDYVVSDSLPLFTQELPVEQGGAHYDVGFYYPEYAPVSSEERKWIKKIEQEIGKVSQPKLDISTVVEQKKKRLVVTFVPFVFKEGKWLRITSCKLKVLGDTQSNLHDRRTLPLSEKSLSTSFTGKENKQNTSTVLPFDVEVVEKASQRWASSSVLNQGRWVKIRVEREGIYNLSVDFLRKAGFSQPSRVKVFGYGGLLQDERLLFDTESENELSRRVPDDLVEVPTLSEGNQILFWAEGTQLRTYDKTTQKWSHENNFYSRYSYYFLTEGDAPLRVKSLSAVTSTVSNTVEKVPYAAIWDEDEAGLFDGGRRMFEGHDFATQNQKTFSVSVPDLAEKAGLLPVEVSFAASSTTSSTTADIQLNGNSLGKLSASAYNSLTSSASLDTKTFRQSIREGNNTFAVTTTAGNTARMDYVRISYPRLLKVAANPYSFSPLTEGTTSLSIQAATPSTRLWRIGQKGSPTAEVPRASLAEGRAVFTIDTPKRRYVAFNSAERFPEPQLVGQIATQNLHADANIDYVIIIPASGKLTQQAERLAALHRQHSGLKVKVVRADQLYNEFSSGTPDANAYRRYLKMLYDRADDRNAAPRYLLFLGKSSWDNRFLTEDWKRENPDDYLLAYEADASSYSIGTVNSYTTDDFFALLDDGEGEAIEHEKPDVATGRMTAITNEQAKVLVDKVERYLRNEDAGDWKNNVVVLGDDGDANEHMEDAERVSKEYEKGSNNRLNMNKIYWDRYRRENSAIGLVYPMVRQQALQALKEGSAIFNYSGHGAPYRISYEAPLQLVDFKKTYNNRQALWVLASCEIYPFDSKEENIAEEFLYQPNGGAIAFMCAARAVYATQNNALNRRFAFHVVGRDDSGKRIAMGEALRKAKNDLLTFSGKSYREVDNSINKLKYVYFGDPALVLSIPTGSVVVDSINGKPVTKGTKMQLEVGSVARFSGHVTTSAQNTGDLDANFSGLLSATIYDRMEKVVCKDNDGSAASRNRSPFTFNERRNVVFKGNARVEKGKFSFSAVVPRNISYTNDLSRLSLYAVSDDKKTECNGFNEQFFLNGTAKTAAPDTLAPKVVAYLNQIEQADYAVTGQNATLIAEISDDAGINASQGALGHDMEMMLDNEAPISMNKYFGFALGSYNRGQIVYPLTNLSPGQHTLKLRVWDVNDNASTTTIRFIASTQRLAETTLTTTDNPARGATTLVANFPPSEKGGELFLDIFDASGVVVYQHHHNFGAGQGSWSQLWSLRTNSGARLTAGLYPCRLEVRYADGRKSTVSYKLVVVE